jgi:diguanylate cyclase (GGDEF)-like protein/PAS domain S-box-containing protein
MSLARLTRALLLAALLGVAGTALLGGYAWRQARAFDAERAELLQIQSHADEISASADALLLTALSDERLREFERTARHVQDHLRDWTAAVPSAQRGIAAIDGMLALAREHRQRSVGPTPPLGRRIGPLALPAEAVRGMSHMASYGRNLDGAIAELLSVHEATETARVRRATAIFASLSTAFALVVVLSLWLVRRRVGQPITDLARVVDRVSQGDATVRARPVHRDELGRLAQAFNGMLDRIRRDEAALRAREAGLRRSLAGLAEAQRIARLGSWTWRLADDRVTWSAQCYRITGTDPDALEPTLDAFARLVHPDDRQAFASGRSAVLDGVILERLDVRLVRPDGDLAHVRLRGEAVQDDDGTPVQVVGTMQDVTDDVRAEATREEQRRLIRMAGRVARVGGWSLDLDTQMLTLSERVLEMMELPAGTSLDLEEGLAFFGRDDREEMRSALDRCAREGTPLDLERQLLTAAGRSRWFRIAGEAVRDERGRIVAIEGAQQDVDTRKRSELQAERAGRRLGEVLRSIDEGFLTVDAEGTVGFANAAAGTLLGLDVDPAGRPAWELLHPGADIVPALTRAILEGRHGTFEIEDDARDRRLELRLEPASEGMALLVRDVTESHRLLSQLRSREAEVSAARDRLADALELQEGLIGALPAHIAVLDAEGTILDVNERWRAFGRDNDMDDPSFGVGSSYLEVARNASGAGSEGASDAARGLEQVLRGERDDLSLRYPCHAPEQERWFRMEVTPVTAGPDDMRRAVVMHVDVTESHLASQRLAQLAYQDALTGVLSRAGFLEELQTHVARGGWTEGATVVSVDLQGFSAINDRHGFAMGDELLTAIGQRLRETVDPAELVARVGGDEFAFLLRPDDVASVPEAELRRLVETVFDRPFELAPGFEHELSAHVGFTRLGSERRPAERLLREAQLALFHGRAQECLGWVEYTPELDRTLQERTRLIEELTTALAEDQFHLHYHPKVWTASGELHAAEALVRWDHPERGLLPPGAFVPIAEQSGLIVPLGQWVLDEACRQLARWRADGLDIVRIAVNVSAEQFATGGFADDVAATLARHGVDPHALTLEVTESVFARESALLRRQLDALQHLGVQLSLDDFGKGYSSLLYLKAYPFDHIKIDRGFVADMLHDGYSRAVVETVIRIGETVGATVVAEGVENDEQRRALAALGCEIAQGFHYCLPMDEEGFRWLLETREPLPLSEPRPA